MNRAERRAVARANKRGTMSRAAAKALAWRPTYSSTELLMADAERPMTSARARHQLTRMYLAMEAIARGQHSTGEDWRLLTDAINLMETLVTAGIARDESALLTDAVTAVAKAWERSGRTGEGMRLDGPGLAACRAVLADWSAAVQQLPERTILAAHVATELRIHSILTRSDVREHDVIAI